MSKITEIIGCFVKARCCTECDWFSQPLLAGRGLAGMMQRDVCPDCGGGIQEMVGRYKIKQTKGLWNNTNEYIGFIRKESDDNHER